MQLVHSSFNQANKQGLGLSIPDLHSLCLYLKQTRKVKLGDEELEVSYWGDDRAEPSIEVVQELFTKWLEEICKQTGQKGQGKFIIFGSYMLGGNVGVDYDVDAICLVPDYVDSKTHFFEDFAKQISNCWGVQNLLTIQAAKAPIIKFTLDGVSFDLSFSWVEQHIIDNFEEMLESNEIFDYLQDESLTAIWGYKACKIIQNSVPS